MQTQDKKRTAYHEAGHAVAHYRLNVSQGGATIIPHDGKLGSVTAEGEGHVWKAEDAPTQVLCYCAGYAALIAAGYSNEEASLGTDDDFEKATKLITDWVLSGNMDEWRRQSVELMSSAENIRAVEFVAKDLMSNKTLPSDYIEQVIDRADGKTSEEEWRQTKSWQFPEMD